VVLRSDDHLSDPISSIICLENYYHQYTPLEVMVTSPLSSGEWPSPKNTPPSVGKTYTQLEIISFFAYHSKKDIVRAVKESGYGPSVTSLYRMFPSKKHDGVFTEYEINEILRGVSVMREEWDKAIEILSKSILVPTKTRIILRQIIAKQQQHQQPEHQDISCGMVPLISTVTTLKLSVNEEDLFKPPKKGASMPPPPQPRSPKRLKGQQSQSRGVTNGEDLFKPPKKDKHNSAQATASIVQDISMPPSPQPRRSERVKLRQQSQSRGVT